jgi:hypothetical protein
VGAGATAFLQAKLGVAIQRRVVPDATQCGTLWSDFFRSALAGVNGDDDCDGGGDDG